MKLKQLMLGIVVSFAIFAFCVPAQAKNFKKVIFENIVTFGDSLSDNGPVNHPHPNYGDGTGSPDLYGFYPFTFGKVWAQQLADVYGAAVFNVAIGGATTGMGNLYPAIDSFAPLWAMDADPATQGDTSNWTGLAWQVNHGLIQDEIASMNKRKTLFTVWAGTNDFNQLNWHAQMAAAGGPVAYDGHTNMLTKEVEIATAKTAVANIRAALDTLAKELGARHILVPNLMSSLTGGVYANVYNTELAAELLNFQTTFSGKLYYVNVYSLCEELYIDLDLDTITLEEKIASGLWWADGYHPGPVIHTALAGLAAKVINNASMCRRHPHKSWLRWYGHNKH